MSGNAVRTVELTLEVPWSDPRWELEDDEPTMPETPLHEYLRDVLKSVLRRWVQERGASALVGGNIALRWDPKNPKVGVDPDVYLVEPAPPQGVRIRSLRTWVDGHSAPRVVLEVVSEKTAHADYHDKPARYAAAGVRELWVFDPELLGPSGEACKLQVWRRQKRGAFRRVYAGPGPAFSEELGAWLVLTEGGLHLRLARDEAGRELWPTEAEAERNAREAERSAKEAERSAKEAERSAKEAERSAKEAALAEVARLHALLAARERGEQK